MKEFDNGPSGWPDKISSVKARHCSVQGKLTTLHPNLTSMCHVQTFQASETLVKDLELQ